MPCILLGDSIAVGVGQFRPECETVAQVGITSGRYISTLLPSQRMSVDQAVISLGVNDGDTADTLENLRTVRARVAASEVYWLLPNLKPAVRDMILAVARERGDQVIDTSPVVGRDHLHPTGAGYQHLAAMTGGNEEVAEYDPSEYRASRRARRLATPAERIHRLKLSRQAELHGGRRHGGATPVVYARPHAYSHGGKAVVRCTLSTCGRAAVRG